MASELTTWAAQRLEKLLKADYSQDLLFYVMEFEDAKECKSFLGALSPLQAQVDAFVDELWRAKAAVQPSKPRAGVKKTEERPVQASGSEAFPTLSGKRSDTQEDLIFRSMTAVSSQNVAAGSVSFRKSKATFKPKKWVLHEEGR